LNDEGALQQSALACAGCHGRSGYGGSEGAAVFPSIAARVLFAPGAFARSSQSGSPPDNALVSRARARSAYDDATFGRALRDGLDPDGKALKAPMPRYAFDAAAMTALTAYMRQLSIDTAPGIEGRTLHLATVLTPDAPAARRTAIIETVRAYAASQAQQGQRWQVSIWQLDGAPGEWAAQLERFHAAEPVFALLSGAGAADWRPVDRFCEQARLPCLFPSLDQAPEGGSDFYSIYFSAGVALEAKVLAAQAPPGGGDSRLHQWFDEPVGAQAAGVLADARPDADRPRAAPPAGQMPAALQGIAADDRLVLWMRAARLKELFALTGSPDAGIAWPRTIFLSATLADPLQLEIPAGLKPRIRFVSAYDRFAPRRAWVRLLPWLSRVGLGRDELRSRADAYAACALFGIALSEVQRLRTLGIAVDFNRELLIESLQRSASRWRDDAAPFYAQLNVGPGRHIAVDKGQLLRYATPAGNELVVDELAANELAQRAAEAGGPAPQRENARQFGIGGNVAGGGKARTNVTTKMPGNS
jgi:hypothetical protein